MKTALLATALAFVEYKRSETFTENETRIVKLTEGQHDTVSAAGAMYKVLDACPWRRHLTEFGWSPIYQDAEGNLYCDLIREVTCFDPVSCKGFDLHSVTEEHEIPSSSFWEVESWSKDGIYGFPAPVEGVA